MIKHDRWQEIVEFHKAMGYSDVDLNDYTLALFMEVAELVESYSWKPWKPNKGTDIENLKRELVDIIFFLVRIMSWYQLTPEDLDDKFKEVIANNKRRYVKPEFVKEAIKPDMTISIKED